MKDHKVDFILMDVRTDPGRNFPITEAQLTRKLDSSGRLIGIVLDFTEEPQKQKKASKTGTAIVPSAPPPAPSVPKKKATPKPEPKNPFDQTSKWHGPVTVLLDKGKVGWSKLKDLKPEWDIEKVSRFINKRAKEDSTNSLRVKVDGKYVVLD